MSGFDPRLPARPSLEQLKKQAKELLRSCRAGEPEAVNRLRTAGANFTDEPQLADAQFAIARELGFETWAKLRRHIEDQQPPRADHYDNLAKELASAYIRGDAWSVRELNWTYGTSFVCDIHDPESTQKVLKTWFASADRTEELALADAREMVARSYGLGSWRTLVDALQQSPERLRQSRVYFHNRPPFYRIEWETRRLSVHGPLSADDWDTVAAAVKEHGIEKLCAGGINDEGMERISRLEQLTHLEVGSKLLTDEGAKHLGRMAGLVELEIGGWTSPLTDRALEFLAQLSVLKRFQCCWTQGFSDEGLAALASCPELETVNLMGTPAGDGAIRAMAGKAHLCHFLTGRGVTDAGLPLLAEIPNFREWRGGEVRIGLMGAQAEPTQLTIDGPITNAGLSSLSRLQGLAGLSLFWHCTAFSAAGLAAFQGMPQLALLGVDGKHINDEAMRYIAAMSGLRMLVGQGALASDRGFAELSRSRSIEYIWGRECPNLTGEGFAALAAMPKLRGLAVSCKRVDDDALSKLPEFPALRELMPMDLSDSGFRHVGRCNLERLWCMYCRDTGDTATEHIASLNLRTYYAGMTQITDRSLEILSRMNSLEVLEFWQCAGLTDEGIAKLKILPRLREMALDGLPGVGRKVIEIFPAAVRVRYDV